jgi:hypothetical protein
MTINQPVSNAARARGRRFLSLDQSPIVEIIPVLTALVAPLAKSSYLFG